MSLFSWLFGKKVNDTPSGVLPKTETLTIWANLQILAELLKEYH